MSFPLKFHKHRCRPAHVRVSLYSRVLTFSCRFSGLVGALGGGLSTLSGYNGLPSVLSGLDDSMSDVAARKKYPFELEKAIHNVMFIQHHMQRQDEFNAVSSAAADWIFNWKFRLAGGWRQRHQHQHQHRQWQRQRQQQQRWQGRQWCWCYSWSCNSSGNLSCIWLDHSQKTTEIALHVRSCHLQCLSISDLRNPLTITLGRPSDSKSFSSSLFICTLCRLI